MTSMLEYKGYLGSVEYSDEDEVLHGRLEFIRDLGPMKGKMPKASRPRSERQWTITLSFVRPKAASPMCP